MSRLLRAALATAFFASPSVAQTAPPHVVRVLKTDTLVVDSLAWGESRSVWPYEIMRVSALGDTWVRLSDPFGGTFFGPSTLVATFGEEVVAYAEGREARSVLFLPKPLGLTVLVLLSVGGLTMLALPFGWYRRRYLRELDRRRSADRVRHQLAEGRETERLLLAQELHDGPVQDLHTLRLRLSLLVRSAGQGGPPGLGEAIDEVVEEVQRVIRDVRGVSEALRPPALGPFGLAAALRTFADRFGHSHGEIAIGLDLDDDGQALPEPVRLALFRIAQEAMNNAAKHGRPRRIDVAFRVGTDPVVLDVEDDGVGYDAPAHGAHPPAATRRYGLLGMTERAESIGADLQITSDPTAGGTRVRVCLPHSSSKRGQTEALPYQHS